MAIQNIILHVNIFPQIDTKLYVNTVCVYWMFTIRTDSLVGTLDLDTISPTQLLKRGEEWAGLES